MNVVVLSHPGQKHALASLSGLLWLCVFDLVPQHNCRTPGLLVHVMCCDPMYTWLVDELPLVLMASLSSMSVTATLSLALLSRRCSRRGIGQNSRGVQRPSQAKIHCPL